MTSANATQADVLAWRTPGQILFVIADSSVYARDWLPAGRGVDSFGAVSPLSRNSVKSRRELH
jgi:hypothetical protein